MGAFTSAEIRIDTSIPIEDLQAFHMEIKRDAHAIIFLRGFVPQEVGEGILFDSMEDVNLKVWLSGRLLFSGLIREVQVTQEGEGYQVSLQGISKTVQMDYEKKNRTFQNVNSTYQDVMREVLGVGADLNFYVSDQKIESPLYQLEETDWEFIRRLASHLRTSIVPFVITGRPAIGIGLPVGRTCHQENMDAYEEGVWFDKERMSWCRRISTYEDLELGDRVKWKDFIYTVTDKSCCLDKGLLCFRYILISKEAFTAKKYANPQAIGRLLSARVLETKDEQVKMKFDIDQSQSVEDAYWYPWRPDAGNLMYCMPEKGEQVYIHLGDYSEKQVRAVCCVHGNGEGHPEMQATDRYFTTSDNKRMYLLPEQMGFKDLKQTSPLEVSLADDSGVSAISNKSIVILAKDTVGIKGSNVFFQAPKEVSLVRRDGFSPTVINMCNGFDSVGTTNEVAMKGTGAAGFPSFSEYEQEAGMEYGLDGIEKEIIASTPCKDLKSGIEKQIRGIQVNRIGTE
ncbi:MAG: hypothetical protein HDQ97_11100 [Lachnospiraceae bacterium]|nr:hypothetical protein [Lachnospiraceae bacterium]